jgi:hypothetical protein
MNLPRAAREAASSLISVSSWRRQLGISDTTAWRWTKAGLIHPVNIAGRPYLLADDIAAFEQRAVSGELAKAPKGAARRSWQARAQRLAK